MLCEAKITVFLLDRQIETGDLALHSAAINRRKGFGQVIT